ncbi:metallophosphoesterase [Paenibacillus tarimensis]
MKRRLVISDIHGCYEPFNQLLELVKYHPVNDQLILLGDYVDRGADSRKVLDQVLRMVRDESVIALQGNHDERFADVVMGRHGEAKVKFFEHGGLQTMESYLNLSFQGAEAMREELLEKFVAIINERYMHHVRFLDELPWFYEDEDHIYVHAGINPDYMQWKEQPKRDFLYIKDPFIKKPISIGKRIIFGHTKTIDIHGSPDIWYGDGKIGIDGGCAYGCQLNCLEILGRNKYRTYSVQAERNGYALS